MTEKTAGPVRNLEYAERAKWGTCPVCKAPHGKSCRPEIGLHMGFTVDGRPPKDGVHLGRLNAAPFKVREVPIA